MKYIYLLLFVCLFGINNVAADTVGEFCNNENLIPFIQIVSIIINAIKIGVPIILIVLGMIDMGKAVASQKEDDIKKGQKTLLSRCLNAGIVFFIIAIVQLIMNILNNVTGDSVWDCVCKFVGGCSTNVETANNLQSL